MKQRNLPLLLAAGPIALAVLVAGALSQPPQPDAPPVALAPESRLDIEQFMTGLACIESSGRYSAVNADSGAIGKYQIMPRNWRVWSARFLDDPAAEPTPENQERVARIRIERLHGQLGSWRRVAYWWLTGQTIAEEAEWTDKARGYVDRVMEVARRSATPAVAHSVPQRCRRVAPDAPVAPDRPAAPDRQTRPLPPSI